MLQWAWAYVTRNRGSRLITGVPVAWDEAVARPAGLDDVDAEARAA
jgi:hypothetical protein